MKIENHLLQRGIDAVNPQMPQIEIKFGRETGEINIEIDPKQFKDPNELRAWAENVQQHLFSRIMLRPGEKLDSRDAAGKVQAVISTLVRHQAAVGNLKCQEGQWRYVGA